MSIREINRTRARVDTGARAMAPAVHAVLLRYAALLERKAMAAARRKRPIARSRVLRKADTLSKVERDLARVIEVYGLQQAEGAAKRVADAPLPETYLRELSRRSIFTAKRMLARTEQGVTESVNRVIVDGLAEDPPATVSDIAKRIREQFHGVGGGRAAEATESDVTVRTGTTKRLSTERGVTYWISSERAATIARTEVGEAEEAGKVAGYEALGAEELEWIARKWPQGRHQSMHGQRVKIGEKFKYPDGRTGSYPRSPDSPVGHRVNCHCTTKPVFKRKKKS